MFTITYHRCHRNENQKKKIIIFLQDLFQMGATSYPGMTQPFSMSHSSNMGSVGVRQDSMGKCSFCSNKKLNF